MNFDQALCTGSAPSQMNVLQQEMSLDFILLFKVLSPEGEGLMMHPKLYRNFFKEEIHLRPAATEKNDSD